MKLIKQVSLWFQEGASDKIYEVDMCEVGADKFVVNFRYGRRGAALKDGTKTTLPVTESAAIKIYNQLVGSKTKEGYQEVSSYGGETTQPIDFSAEVAQAPEEPTSNVAYTPLERYVLDGLKDLVKPAALQGKDLHWPLSRIVWRVGELRLRSALPTLVSLIPQSDAMQQYSIAWAMGRCGDSLAIPTLTQLSRAAASKSFVKQIASWSIYELETGEPLQKLQAQLLSALPEALSTNIIQQNTEAYGKAFEALPRDASFPQHLSLLYQLSKHFPMVLPSIHAALHQLPFKGSYHFKAVRQMLKMAELRDDFKTLGVLSYLVEKRLSFYNSNSYYVYVDNRYVDDARKEVTKPDSRLGYSAQTRLYFRRRSWRILRTLAESEKWPAYIDFAVEHLLQFKDSDMTPPQIVNKSEWHWDSNSRHYTQTTKTIKYKASAHLLTFNKVLFGQSPRFELSNAGKVFKVKDGHSEVNESVNREENYPKAWDAHPHALVRILKESHCHTVHQFAVKALKDNAAVLNDLTVDDLKQILKVPYPETVQLCIELAEKLFNPLNPDVDFVLVFMESSVAEARALAYRWIGQHPSFYQEHSHFLGEVFQSKHTENLNFLVEFLSLHRLSDEMAKAVIAGVLKKMLEGYTQYNPQNAEHITEERRLAKINGVLFKLFEKEIKTIDLAVPNALLKKASPMIQTLAALILLNHVTPAEKLPEGTIAALINAEVKAVRETGVFLFGRLPDEVLLNSEEMLKSFCLSSFPEIRTAIRPTIKRLADNSDTFGRRWVDEMMPFFRMKEHYEGLHQDLYLLFTESLGAHLAHIDTDTVLKLLQSSLLPRQSLGAFLLENTVNTQELTMRQITKLADHEILAVREWAQTFYQNNTPRIKYEAAEALRILDAKWDDARQFFFQFFRNAFSENDWTPELLVFVCDSTRPDVQQFGKEMITKFFKEENGSRYLMQLSQHPSANLQNFATHYLEQFAADRPEQIAQLEHYFITILSQVNRSGVAKARIFQFLQEEGLKDEANANMISQIMNRQSATMAVADKAATLKVMAALKMKYPNLEMAMNVCEVRVVQGKG